MSEKEEHRRDTEKRITEKQAGGKKKTKKQDELQQIKEIYGIERDTYRRMIDCK